MKDRVSKFWNNMFVKAVFRSANGLYSSAFVWLALFMGLYLSTANKTSVWPLYTAVTGTVFFLICAKVASKINNNK